MRPLTLWMVICTDTESPAFGLAASSKGWVRCNADYPWPAGIMVFSSMMFGVEWAHTHLGSKWKWSLVPAIEW